MANKNLRGKPQPPNRLQDLKEIILDIKDKVEEINITVKEK